MEYKKVHDNVINGIRSYFDKSNYKKAVIGLSGGIDSAVSLSLTVDALGKKNVTALLMPEIGLSSIENFRNAKQFANNMKVNNHVIPINNFLRPYNKLGWDNTEIASMNIKARTRSNILYHYANSNNCLVIGTSNKTELLLGYFTKYGDGAVDLEVIGELYKTEVIGLAKYLKIPDSIILSTPTAELYAGHSDEKELGGPYREIDNILSKFESGLNPKGKLAQKIKNLIKANRHKTLPIPMVKAK